MENQLTRLRQFITKHFSLDDVRTLCLDLSVDYDELSGENKSAKVRALLLYLGHRRQFKQLLGALRRSRPRLYQQDGLNDDPTTLNALYAALPTLTVESTSATPIPPKRPLRIRWVVSVGLVVVIAIAIVFYWIKNNDKNRSSSPIEKPEPVVAITFTSTPTPTPTPTSTSTPTPTPTSTDTPTPTPTLRGEITRTREIDGMVMVRVPGGTFKMGSSEAEIDTALEQCAQDRGVECPRSWFADESPPHTVTLDSFWIDQTEVTNAQYRKCVEAGVCDAPTTCDYGEPTYDDESKADHPVVCVDWDGANAYCEWAGVRLPTEAEWEYAARGSERSTYPWGEAVPTCKLAQFNICPGQTVSVGSLLDGASWCRALNMAGNVVEWVNDWYDGYPGTTYQSEDFGTQYKVLRGGSWFTYRTGVRSADRSKDVPSSSSDSWGLRCAAADTPFPSDTREVTITATSQPTDTPTSKKTATPRPTDTPMATEVPALGIGSTVTREVDGMVMVYVPEGTFQMGSSQEEIDAAFEQCEQDRGSGCRRDGFERESPKHTVTSDSFWIDQTEVTNAQYRKCVVAGACEVPTKCDFGEPTYEDESKADHPVVCVDWYGSRAYCEWAGSRLPTEAEWEYAARGLEGRTYPWGDTFDGQRLNFCDASCTYDLKDTDWDDGYELTAPVGSFEDGASWCEALDMAGNVDEWVNDWYQEDYYAVSPVSNPTGPETGIYGMLRGGSWGDGASGVRSAYRVNFRKDYAHFGIGFRCVGAATHRLADTPSAIEVSALDIGSTTTREQDGAVMAYVPAGTFQMGSSEAEIDAALELCKQYNWTGDCSRSEFDNESPQHTVTLDSFWIDKHEVTKAQFTAFLNNLGNQTAGGVPWLDLYSEHCLIEQTTSGEYLPKSGYGNQPVVGVSWYGAAAYCEWAGGRLPTEAEWEYAARGSQGNTYPWGDYPPTCELAHYSGCSGPTSVGTLRYGASWCSALDLAGNVWEWVNDWYGEYPSTAKTNPTGPETGDNKVLRGGSWDHSLDYLRSAFRIEEYPGDRIYFLGFRCVVSATP